MPTRSPRTRPRAGPASTYEQRKQLRQRHIGELFWVPLLAAVVGTRVGVPPGPLIYLAAWAATFRHQQDPTHVRYAWWQQLRLCLLRPPLGLHAQDSPWWIPDAMSTWVALPVTLLFCRLVPQPLPLVSAPFIYALIQAGAAAGRQVGYKGSPLPSCSVIPEGGQGDLRALASTLADEGTANLALGALGVGAALFVAVLFAGHFAFLGRHPWVPPPSWVRAARRVHIDLAHSRVGPLPMAQAVELGGLLGLCGAAWTWIGRLRPRILQPWKERQDKREMWDKRWEALGPAGLPIFQGETDMPRGASPTYTMAVFQIPPGCDYWAFDGFGSNLGSILGVDVVLVAPLPAVDENNRRIPATVGTAGFTVSWPKRPLGPNPHLRDEWDPQTLQFAVQYATREAFISLRLGVPLFHSCRVLVSSGSFPDQRMPLIEAIWRLPHGLSMDGVTRRARALQEKLEAPWLAIGRRPGADLAAGELISIIYGQLPTDLTRLDFSTRQFLESLRWEQAFRVCKMVNAWEETAQYVDTQPGRFGLQVAQFSALRGVSVIDLQTRAQALSPTINYPFVELIPRDTDGGFSITYGQEDPLNRTYRFVDYLPQLLQPPSPEPDVSFFVGVGSDGELIRFLFEDESPHLLVAGATGKGKSVLLHSMILQLATRNSPSQWELRIAEPKNEMQRYKALPHTTRFVDMSTPAANLYEPLMLMLEELVREMEDRYAAFQQLPGHVRNIQDAWRSEALQEKPPYITCLIEECADYFAKPPASTAKVARAGECYERAQSALELLARKSRAAGIYLVYATQRPTKDAIPAPVKGNSRRIGLGTHDNISSMIIIDRPGLENIKTPGRGLVSSKGAYRGFKGFFFGQANAQGEDEVTPYLQPLLVLDPGRPLGPVADQCLQLPLCPPGRQPESGRQAPDGVTDAALEPTR